MTVIIGRSGWKALPPNRVAPPLRVALTVVVHHSATGFATDILDAEAITLAIQRDHLARTKPDGVLEFSDIAYNLLVGPDVVLLGRGIDIQGGATGNGYDDRTVSVCVIGNLADNDLPAAERRALVYAIQMCWDRYGVTSIEPHRNFYATSCPGDHLVEQLASIEAEAKDEDTMTPQDIDALATAIVDKWFAHPMTLRDDVGGYTYKSNADGAIAFIHGELKTIRQKEESRP